MYDRDEIVFVELNPSQEYRSSVLSGLRPEIIMEICTRAISFWTYQTSQEARYQEMALKALEDKAGLFERQIQQVTQEYNIEVNDLQKDIEQEKCKSADLSEQLDEKLRQLSKLQILYEREKRRPLFSDEMLQAHQSQERDDMFRGGNIDLQQRSFAYRASSLPDTLPQPTLLPTGQSKPGGQPIVYDRVGNLATQHRASSYTGSPSQSVFRGTSAGQADNSDSIIHTGGLIGKRMSAWPLLGRRGHTSEREQIERLPLVSRIMHTGGSSNQAPSNSIHSVDSLARK
ncbi:cyclin B1 interacting protein 1, E3 ubiquitin protein ligase [Mortierella sp. AM989]|nr:cyclin B1 interacting protein 1, E3 ubiquitin protein ligase [Mortierella sp. AM989]